jgi:hypothetical protein
LCIAPVLAALPLLARSAPLPALFASRSPPSAAPQRTSTLNAETASIEKENHSALGRIAAQHTAEVSAAHESSGSVKGS